MFKREIYRTITTEDVFVEGFIEDIRAKSEGRIVCTAKDLTQATPAFILTVDGGYSLTFTRVHSTELAANGWYVGVSRGTTERPFLCTGFQEYWFREIKRTIRYSIISSGRAMLLEFGGYTDFQMATSPVISILSTKDNGLSGVAMVLANYSAIPTNFALSYTDGTELYVHDRTDMQYDTDEPRKLQIAANKQLYDAARYRTGSFVMAVPGLKDCMQVPARLHFIAGGREYYSLDDYTVDFGGSDPSRASTVMEV